jgi:4-hydroxy-tetrahydrodipicolinate reductase
MGPLVVIGGRGRLGALIVDAATAAGRAVVVVGRGDDVFGAVRGAAAVVDVATAGATGVHVDAAAAAGVPVVVATTGLKDVDHAAIAAAATRVPILVAANLSPGAHLVALLAQTAATVLGEADVEIVEVHHNKKKDAPSGTALMLADAVKDARTARGQRAHIVRSRDGDAPRVAGDIGVVAVRGGDVVGEHTVSLFGDGERVELVHKVSSRAIFARGALWAADFLVGKAPGRYQMTDVLKARLG